MLDGSSDEFVERQERLFDNLADVPLAEYRLVANWDRYGDLARPHDQREYGTEEVSIPLTEERYRLRGFDRYAAVEDAYFTFVKRAGRWLIAEDSDLGHLGLFTVRHPWDFGPLEVHREGRFLIVEPDAARGCGAAPAGLADQAEAAVRRVDSYWRPQWRKRVALVVPCDAKEVKRLLQATFDASKFVAFSYATIDLDHGYRYTGHRVIVNPPVFNDRPAGQALTILAHELLHVASRDVSGPFVPLFVDEGIADLVGYAEHPYPLGYLDAAAATGSFDGRLPQDFQFSTGTGAEIFLSYQKAQSAMRFLAGRWGLDALTRFYKELGRRSYVPGVARWQLDDALRSTLDIGLDGFEREWAATIGP